MFAAGELHPEGRKYYDGEVFLAPPRERVPGLQTTFGVIQIHLYNETKSITISRKDDVEYFGTTTRDSICKQMGFTQAKTNSVFTVNAASAGFNFDQQYYP